MIKQPTISIIISTYNSESWLEKVLWSYNNQLFTDFEVIIADDGSKQPTLDLINYMKPQMNYPITHVWQEDNGFQKTKILNKAILKCNSNYILMTDGDCIARNDFVQVHVNQRAKGYFLSGGYFMLPMSISQLIRKEDIESQNCFNLKWLKANGLASSFKNNKLTAEGLKTKFFNTLTTTNASWNGHNASGWKSDILAVNGMDERMQYGGEDRELGERLINYGIASKQIRYSAICLHLDHPRSYKNMASIKKNMAIRANTRNKKIQWTDFGIIKR